MGSNIQNKATTRAHAKDVKGRYGTAAGKRKTEHIQSKIQKQCVHACCSAYVLTNNGHIANDYPIAKTASLYYIENRFSFCNVKLRLISFGLEYGSA